MGPLPFCLMVSVMHIRCHAGQRTEGRAQSISPLELLQYNGLREFVSARAISIFRELVNHTYEPLHQSRLQAKKS
jgi:hypothetical protein